MRVCCPSCRAEMSAEVWLQAQEDRQALAQLLSQGLPLGAPLLRYVGLFRTGPNALSLARTQRLLSELLPDIERGAVTAKGRDWPASPSTWLQALEQVEANRQGGTLRLPLRSHGYLVEILVSLADQAEGAAEKQHEQELRGRAHVGGGLTTPAAAIAAPAPAPAPVPVVLRPPPGPSRAAREIQAEIAARKAKAG